MEVKMIIKICNILRFSIIGGLIVLLFFSFANFSHINKNTEDCVKSMKDNIRSINDSILDTTYFEIEDTVHSDSSRKDTLFVRKQVDITGMKEFNYYINEIEKNKKGVFDSNTITFIISFILVGMVSLFIGIDNKISKHLEEIQKHKLIVKALDRMDELYSKIQIMLFIAIQINIDINMPVLIFSGRIYELLRQIQTGVEDISNRFDSFFHKEIFEDNKRYILDNYAQIIFFLTLPNTASSDIIGEIKTEQKDKESYLLIYKLIKASIDQVKDKIEALKVQKY